jgi:hypothetical protein
MEADLPTIDEDFESLLDRMRIEAGSHGDGGGREPARALLENGNDKVEWIDAVVVDRVVAVRRRRSCGLWRVHARASASAGTLRFGGVGRADALEEDRGCLVCRVMRRKFAAEGLGEGGTLEPN